MFDFHNFNYYTHRNQETHKKRRVIELKNNSFEKRYINEINKKIIKIFNIKYTNKNDIYSKLYEFSFNKPQNYTVLRCDFKNYGNSLNINYILEKYNIKKYINGDYNNFLKDYANTIKNCQSGVNLHTTLIEIISKDFDRQLQTSYDDIVFYERYVDDLLIIFNKVLDFNEIKKRLDKIIIKVFYDKKYAFKNNVKIHYDKKFELFNSNNLPTSFDFLGFRINFDKKITFGITDKDKIKLETKMTRLITTYKNNESALKNIFNILSKGIVYKKIKNNNEKWIFKGFASKCRFLARFDNFTIPSQFYEDLKHKTFEKLNLPYPKFLDKSCYNLEYNIKSNRYFVLDKKAGLPKEKLLEIVKTFDINCREAKYFDLAKIILKLFTN